MTQEEFGQKIKDIRISMDLTQDEFANKLDWSCSQSVARIESGKTPFPPDKVLLLCNIAPNISIEDIISSLVKVKETKIREKVFSGVQSNK